MPIVDSRSGTPVKTGAGAGAGAGAAATARRQLEPALKATQHPTTETHEKADLEAAPQAQPPATAVGADGDESAVQASGHHLTTHGEEPHSQVNPAEGLRQLKEELQNLIKLRRLVEDSLNKLSRQEVPTTTNSRTTKLEEMTEFVATAADTVNAPENNQCADLLEAIRHIIAVLDGNEASRKKRAGPASSGPPTKLPRTLTSAPAPMLCAIDPDPFSGPLLPPQAPLPQEPLPSLPPLICPGSPLGHGFGERDAWSGSDTDGQSVTHQQRK